MFVKVTGEKLVGLKYNSKVKIQSILEFGDHTGNTRFWPSSPKIFFINFLSYVNLHQHTKNLAISLIFPRDVVH